MKYWVSVAGLSSQHLLLGHPAESAALVAHFHANTLMQHLMALQAFPVTLNGLLIAPILLHGHAGVSHGCT